MTTVSTLARTQAEQDGTLDVNALSIHLQGIEFGGDHAVGAYFAYLVAELATRPDIQDRLRQDPALIDSFVLETLRIDPPIPGCSASARWKRTSPGKSFRKGRSWSSPPSRPIATRRSTLTPMRFGLIATSWSGRSFRSGEARIAALANHWRARWGPC